MPIVNDDDCKGRVNSKQVQRSAEKAAADIEWDEEDETEEGDGELI